MWLELRVGEGIKSYYQAHYQAHVQGRGLRRGGDIYILWSDDLQSPSVCNIPFPFISWNKGSCLPTVSSRTSYSVSQHTTQVQAIRQGDLL